MLTLTPANHYNGVVTLSCGTLPAYTTCTFNPPTVTMDGHTPVTVQLTITTTSVSASAEVLADVNPRHGSAILMASLGGIGLFGMVFAAGSKKRNHYSAVLLALLAVSMTMAAVGCGKEGSTPASAATTTTVVSSQSPAAAGTAVAFNATVSASSGTPDGTLTFMDGTTQIGTGTLVSGKASFQTTSLTTGSSSITASYAGNSSFNASTSSARCR